VSGSLRAAAGAFWWEGVYLGTTRAIQLVRFVILARLLSPRDFGLLAVAWAVVEVGQGLSDLGFEKAVIQRSHVSDHELDAAWTFDVLRCGALALVIAAFAPGIAVAFGEAGATNLIRALSVTPILYALASIKRIELQRRLEFRSLTFMRLPEMAVEAVIAIVLAPRIGVWALAVAAWISISCTVTLSYVLAPHRPRLIPDWNVGVGLFRFSRWLTVTGVSVMVGEATLRAVISRQLGTESLGIFYLATRLAILPLGTVSQVVWTVGFTLHGQLQAEVRRAATAFQYVLTSISVLLLPVYALLFVLADALTVHVLGPKWFGSTQIIRILALANVAAIGGAAIRPMLEGRGHPRYASVLIGANQALVVSSAYVIGQWAGIIGVAWVRTIIEVALLSAWVWAAKQVLPNAFQGIGKIMLTAGASATLAGLAALAVVSATGSAWGALMAALIGAAMALAVLLALDLSLQLGFVANVKRILLTLFSSPRSYMAQ
jgi:O-antigen/teichoic acid export membrane protein